MGWGGDDDVPLHLHTCETLHFGHTSHGMGWGGDADVLLHLHTCEILLCTNKFYSVLSTTLYYKVLLQYYSVLQSTTPVLLCTTKYYSVVLQYHSVLQSTTPVLCKTLSKHQRQQFTPGAIPNLRPKRSKIYARSDPPPSFLLGSIQKAKLIRYSPFPSCLACTRLLMFGRHANAASEFPQ